MRNVDRATLEMLGNRYREAVAAAYIVQEGERLTVTISIGATLVRSDDTVESLIKRADSLLYRSKRDGRNRLTIDAPGEVIPQ
jgi:diguanylate cyclase (GGDEF)-like protein